MTALAIALGFASLLAYLSFRDWLSRRYLNDSVLVSVADFKAEVAKQLAAKDANVKQLLEDVSFLKMRAGL